MHSNFGLAVIIAVLPYVQWPHFQHSNIFRKNFVFHCPGDIDFAVSSFVYPDDMQSSYQVNKKVISFLKAALALTLNMHHICLKLCTVYCNTLETCNAALSQLPCLSKLSIAAFVSVL